MRKILLALLLIPAVSFGAANDLFMNQRNDIDTGTLSRTITKPAGTQDGIVGYKGVTIPDIGPRPWMWTLGSGLAIQSDALVVLPQSWTSITGKPSFATVATTGAYADLSGRPSIPAAQVQSDWNATLAPAAILNKPPLFSGAYADLSGIPLLFAPAAHTHAAGDIVSGVLAVARIPMLAISQTTGLQTALDSKFAIPSGTAAQYVTGTGALSTFPAIPAPQQQVDWLSASGITSIANKPALAPVATSGAYSSLTGIPSTFTPSAHIQAFSTITATPTTLAGYGIADGATLTQLATKFNTPAGTNLQYVRGDGTLATLPVARRIETYAGTTNASGQIVVTYASSFASVPVVQPPAPGLASQVWTTISSTTTGFTLQLNQRNVVTLLGLEVLLGATVPVSGAAATVLVVSQ